jgi:hypothetical protein
MEMGESHIGNTPFGEDENGSFFYGDPRRSRLLRGPGSLCKIMKGQFCSQLSFLKPQLHQENNNIKISFLQVICYILSCYNNIDMN